jgi:hypothetical protein
MEALQLAKRARTGDGVRASSKPVSADNAIELLDMGVLYIYYVTIDVTSCAREMGLGILLCRALRRRALSSLEDGANLFSKVLMGGYLFKSAVAIM